LGLERPIAIRYPKSWSNFGLAVTAFGKYEKIKIGSADALKG
jgi:hypothetical protein